MPDLSTLITNAQAAREAFRSRSDANWEAFDVMRDADRALADWTIANGSALEEVAKTAENVIGRVQPIWGDKEESLRAALAAWRANEPKGT